MDLNILPAGRTPKEFNTGTLPETPSFADLLAVYHDCKGGPDTPHPREVVICVDISTPMRGKIGPALDAFEAWLESGGGSTPAPRIPWREIRFRGERWLREACDRFWEFR